MEIKDFKTEDYQVYYKQEAQTIVLSGSLRLSGLEETNPVVKLLNDVLDENPENLIFDLRDLEFLNSSGINMLSKFVIKVRQKQNISLKILASTDIPWQGKSLKNLQRLLPSLQLELE